MSDDFNDRLRERTPAVCMVKMKIETRGGLLIVITLAKGNGLKTAIGGSNDVS